MGDVARPRRHAGACAAAALFAGWLSVAAPRAGAQGEPAPAPAPESEPVPAPPAAAQDEGDAAQRLAPVRITGSRDDDVQERRNSTTGKIVVGRDEIDRFGDATLGDVLKRLPGVTIDGRPGRGGAIRFRGLGNGYTQILLDGDRVPAGFSLDSLTPDQVERIEILRAPTAETGARAIAGTINIVTRGGYRRRVNEVRVGAALEKGEVQPALSWTRNQALGDVTVNTSLSVFHLDRDNSSTTTTIDRRLHDGTVTLEQVDDARLRVTGGGVNATARIQWRPAGGADSVTLTPLLFANRFHSRADETLVQSVGATPAPYDQAERTAKVSTALARLNGEWTHHLAPAARVEWRAGVAHVRVPFHSFRSELTDGSESRTLEDTSDSHNTTITASGKLVASVFGQHSLVSANRTGVPIRARAFRTASRS